MDSNFGDRSGACSHILRAIVLAAILVVCSRNETSYGADSSIIVPPAPACDAVPEGTPTAEDIATMLNVRFHIGLQEALKIGQAVLDAGRRDAISPILLLAVIAVESRFDRFAVSVAGARGLMQVLPSQHRDVVLRTSDLTDAGINVSIGSSILHDYIEAAGGNVGDALMRYSGGARNYPRRVADRISAIKTALSLQQRGPEAEGART